MQTLASMFKKVKSFDKVSITKPIDGSILYSDVHFEGIVTTDFAIDLINSRSTGSTTDIALRILVEFDKRLIERKARIAGKWTSSVVSASNFPFQRSTPFTIDVACTNNKYMITINGSTLIFFNHEFKDLSLVDAVSILGDDVSVVKLEMPDAKEPIGTLFPVQNLNRVADSKRMRAAIKKEVDLNIVIDILINRSNEQRQVVKWQFRNDYKQDLDVELQKRLSGEMSEVIVGLLDIPDVYDAKCLHKAMEGIGTDEKALIGILSSRDNQQLKSINTAYRSLYKNTLEEDLQSETSGYFKKLLVAMAKAERDESDVVDIKRARRDAKAIYEAGEGQWGIDESEINEILVNRSDAQLRATFKIYDEISDLGIEGAIKHQAHGDIQDGYLAIIKTACNPALFFAERIHNSMQGLHKDDDQLIRIVISRSEVDLLRIKAEFYKTYTKKMQDFIKEKCNDDFVKVLLGIVKTI